ncbi:autotransporter assembly complex protein TamA [Ramlibacter tataouinensis]|nr:BamA/TamA family outer membrane protein [Ramlibacter tataouinensis]
MATAGAQAPAAAARPSFDLEVRAPDDARELLERHLELRRYREVSDLDEAELARLLVLAERDARELLATQGWFNPQVTLTLENNRQPPLVVVAVALGEPARVSEVGIAFEGDIASRTSRGAAAQREAIRDNWGLPAGQRFTQEAWDDAKDDAVRRLTARRYLRGRISYSLADVDAATGQARLGLRLDSGPLFRLGELQVTGVERYDPVLVPRLARLRPGSLYDQDRIQQAQLRLASSGYFDSAFIYVDPAGDPAAVPVQVTVREAPVQRLVLGLGLTTDAGPRASIEHRHNRLPGIGWQAATRLQLDRKTPFLETEWTAIPDEKGWRWGTLARAERQEDDDQITHARRLRFGRSWSGERIDRNAYLQYDDANVQLRPGAPPAADNGDGTAVSANFVWTGRYFNRAPVATRGFGLGFELGGGLTLTGSRSPFQRTVLRWLQLRPLERGRIQLRTEGGAVLAADDARVPATQLFRAGGDNSVRGYGYRDIGVELPGGVVGPGRYLAVASIEWQRPVRRNGVDTPLEQTFFIDSGAVADRPEDLRPVFGIGTGVRFNSPIGPLQADIAWGLKPQRLRLHLSVGVTF